MKKFFIILAVSIVLIMLLFLGFNKHFQHEKIDKIKSAKIEMKKYLSNKGLNEGDYKLKVDYRLDNLMLGYGGYVITVVYKDEPDVIYGYTYTNGKVSNRSEVNNADVDNKNFKHEK